MHTYAAIQVEAMPNGFGAQISGVNLSEPLPDEQLKEVRQAWADHSVVYFPNQPLSHAQLEAYTLQIGDFGFDPFIKPLAEHPHILELRRHATETAKNFGSAWHSDWSFQESPPAATILHAKVIPPVGGDTLFADCYRAYEALSAPMRQFLDGLTAIHSATRAYGPTSRYATETEARTEAEKTWPHPLVRTHPVTGRKALYVSPTYTLGIRDMRPDESAHLLTFLYAHATQAEYVFRQRWQPNMLTMWDNRCTLHNAEGGYDGHLRLMHRTTVAGEKPM